MVPTLKITSYICLGGFETRPYVVQARAQAFPSPIPTIPPLSAGEQPGEHAGSPLRHPSRLLPSPEGLIITHKS